MTGISRALESPEEAESILRELKMAEKMDRKVLQNKQLYWHSEIRTRNVSLSFLFETFVT